MMTLEVIVSDILFKKSLSMRRFLGDAQSWFSVQVCDVSEFMECMMLCMEEEQWVENGERPFVEKKPCLRR